MASVLLPMIVFGSTIGVYLNVILPEIIETIMLVTLLMFTGTKSLFKGRKLWKQENQQKWEAAAKQELLEWERRNSEDPLTADTPPNDARQINPSTFNTDSSNNQSDQTSDNSSVINKEIRNKFEQAEQTHW